MREFQDAEIEHALALRYTYISCPIWHCFILNWFRATKRLFAARMIQQGLCRTTSAQQCLPRHTRITRQTRHSSDVFNLWISPCHRSLPSWDSVPDLVHVQMIYRPSRTSKWLQGEHFLCNRTKTYGKSECFSLAKCFVIYYYYLADCTILPHLPVPIEHLQYLLSPFVSVIPVFFH